MTAGTSLSFTLEHRGELGLAHLYVHYFSMKMKGSVILIEDEETGWKSLSSSLAESNYDSLRKKDIMIVSDYVPGTFRKFHVHFLVVSA